MEVEFDRDITPNLMVFPPKEVTKLKVSDCMMFVCKHNRLTLELGVCSTVNIAPNNVYLYVYVYVHGLSA